MTSTLWTYPLLTRIAEHATATPGSIAISDAPAGLDISYGELWADVISLATQLQRAANGGSNLSDLSEARVTILCNKGYLVPLALLATWCAGGLALPILPSLPVPEQSYQVTNAESTLIVCDAANRSRAEELARLADVSTIVEMSVESVRSLNPSTDTDSKDTKYAVPDISSFKSLDGDRRAMMLYTSGTTGRPKGVVTRHSALAAQVTSIVQAWHWTARDYLLHVLPLNHLHGIVVALLPTLWCGAGVELWERFEGEKVWRRWINEERKRPVTMFFAVPTIYSRLIDAHAKLPAGLQDTASKASATLRLQVSGSAPLPESVKARWEKEGGVGGGQVLLERYGMTETGLIATTGWENEKRVKGCVGFPMPGMQMRLWDSETNTPVTAQDTPGDVQVRGPNVTKEYWRLPEVTQKEFVNGWFKTGDVAVISGPDGPAAAQGMYRILGRASADIIKSGGEKIGAIEIERAILELGGIEDCAVVGVPSEEWGQVVAACVTTSRPNLTVADLRNELRKQLAAYKLPRLLKVFDQIPRNGMGKIQKKLIVQNEFEPQP